MGGAEAVRAGPGTGSGKKVFHCLRGAGGEVRFGIAHGLVKRYVGADERIHGGEVIEQVGGRGIDGADDGDDGDVQGLGGAEDAVDGLAARGGGVEAAFAGEDEIGAGETFGEGDGIEDEVDAGEEVGTEGGVEAGGKAAAAAGAGEVGNIDAEVAGEQRRRVVEGVDECAHLGVRARAFLRGEGGGGAVGAAEGVRYIAGDVDRCFAEARVERGGVNAGDAAQRAAGERVGDRGAVRVEEADAEGLERAAAGVDGGAAADADDDAGGAAVEGSADQLAGAVGGRAERVAPVVAEELVAGGGRHFDDGGALIGEPAEVGAERRAEGAGDFGGDPLAAALEEGGRGAFAAVGERDAVHDRVRTGAAHTVGNRLRCARGGTGALEGIWCDNDAEPVGHQRAPGAAEKKGTKARRHAGTKGSKGFLASLGMTTDRIGGSMTRPTFASAC